MRRLLGWLGRWLSAWDASGGPERGLAEELRRLRPRLDAETEVLRLKIASRHLLAMLEKDSIIDQAKDPRLRIERQRAEEVLRRIVET